LSSHDQRVKTGFISRSEMRRFKEHLSADETDDILKRSDTNSLREILNKELGTEISLEVNEVDHKRWDAIYKEALQGGAFNAWSAGKISSADVIEKFRTYAKTLAHSLDTGLYDARDEDIKTDASFYEGTGFPVKGEAVFSIEEVENWPNHKDEKPVLIMQTYDPNIVGLLESGKLGGLVVCDTYLASHLTFLCEEKNIPGIFGAIPKDKEGFGGDFNENSKSRLKPYFEEGSTEINGTMLRSGQEIIIGVGNHNGIALKVATVKGIEEKMSKRKTTNRNMNNIPVETLKLLNKCFKKFFSDNEMGEHNVKVNANSVKNDLLRLASGVGLIRTEQVAALDTKQANALRDVLLSGDEASYNTLSEYMRESYKDFFIETDDDDYQVKFRLFDLSPKELFDRQGQTQFHERYKSMDIHGGKALNALPRLYSDQIDAIFQGYKGADRCYNEEPIQVMMPAIRTEEETVKIKEMIQKGAEEANVKGHEYGFGVMIETLDSCNNAESIIKHCDFISFGTNDLTQQVLNIPRDDLKMRAKYKRENGFDPYKSMAPEVLKEIGNVCAVARKINPKIEIDLCGGQAADVNTTLTLFDTGVDNVSVALNQRNLYALPLLLNYQRFDQAQKISHSMKPAVGKMHSK